MLNENIRLCRKRKGLTQEELAASLHVVRQTISKWEKGISVPDASTLLKLADLLDVSVSELMGANMDVDNETDENSIAIALEGINEQLAKRNRHTGCLVKAVLIIFCVMVFFFILLGLFTYIPYMP